MKKLRALFSSRPFSPRHAGDRANPAHSFIPPDLPSACRAPAQGRSAFVAAGLVVALLGGCAYAPGMYLDMGDTDWAKQPNLRLVSISSTAELPGQTQAAALPESFFGPRQPAPYRVGTGDGLSIYLWQVPELTGMASIGQVPTAAGGASTAAAHVVDGQGTIYLPYAGRIKVAGLTVEEIQRLLMDKLSGTVRQPKIEVQVTQFNSQRIVVSGEVRQPGPQALRTEGLDLLAALGTSGPTPDADLQEVALLREGKRYLVNVDAELALGRDLARVRLQAGDVLYVPNRQGTRRVFVTGEVGRTQIVELRPRRQTLADALFDSGGLNQYSADATQVYVIRLAENDTLPTVFQLDMRRPISSVLATRMELQPLDVVYVGAADLAKFNRVITNLIPGATLINTSQRIGNGGD